MKLATNVLCVKDSLRTRVRWGVRERAVWLQEGKGNESNGVGNTDKVDLGQFVRANAAPPPAPPAQP